MKLNYLFTGCPRTGTQYIAKLVTSAGILCSHECYFGMPGVFWCPDGEIRAESSWLAAPFLDKVGDAKIIHIIRNPIKVINSMMADGALDGILGATVHNFWKMMVMPNILSFQGIDRYLYFFIEWNRMIRERGKNPPVYRLEDIVEDPRAWLKETGIYPKRKLFTEKANQHHDDKKYFTLEDFKKMECNKELKQIFLEIYNQFYGKKEERQSRWG
jgi:hypothetical protein